MRIFNLVLDPVLCAKAGIFEMARAAVVGGATMIQLVVVSAICGKSNPEEATRYIALAISKARRSQ